MHSFKNASAILCVYLSVYAVSIKADHPQMLFGMGPWDRQVSYRYGPKTASSVALSAMWDPAMRLIYAPVNYLDQQLFRDRWTVPHDSNPNGRISRSLLANLFVWIAVVASCCATGWIAHSRGYAPRRWAFLGICPWGVIVALCLPAMNTLDEQQKKRVKFVHSTLQLSIPILSAVAVARLLL